MGRDYSSTYIENCGTPEAVYGATFAPACITLTVELPLPVIDALTDEQRGLLNVRLHRGILPAIEWLYEQVWQEHFANWKPAEDLPPLPELHRSLFESGGALKRINEKTFGRKQADG